jgi:hypothetical protein
MAALKVNSLHLTHNDHACNYVTAKAWIEQYSPDHFKGTPAPLVEGMKNANSIWQLHIYPDTPIGSYSWYGPTLDSVFEQARAEWPEIQALR